MSRARFLVCLVSAVVFAGLTASCATAATKAAARKKPNLILIMADDLSAKELSCYGHERHRTPNLDELARTGVQFQTCYTACICHPTRFEIMTGQYGAKNGVYQFAGRPGGPDPRSAEEQIVNHLTFGKVLKEAGYTTVHAGKWQLSGKIPKLVVENGFDEYCMWAYVNNLPEGVEHTGGWEGKPGKKTCRYWHPSIVHNGEYVPTKITDYGPDIFTNFLIEFAKKNREKPFFIYYPMALTHAPYYSTPLTNPNEVEKFRHDKQKFKENVEYTDLLVGRIVKAIDELGLREDTIIIFTGDNGTGGEGKGTPTEKGAHVPMIVNCPGRVKPLGISGALVDTTDVMPTLAELAGATLPADHPIDGHSMVPLITGEKNDTREWIFSYLGDRRVLRTKRWLIEKNHPDDFGLMFDCGDSRNGEGYKDVTDSTDPEVVAARQKLLEILATQPVPEVKRKPNQAKQNQKGQGKGKGKKAKPAA